MNRLERYLKDHYFDDGKNVITIDPKPTLSKIVKDGLQAIDDAVLGVIARHEAEIESLKKPKIDYEKFYHDHINQAVENQRRAYEALGCQQAALQAQTYGPGMAGLQGIGQVGAIAYGSAWDCARDYC